MAVTKDWRKLLRRETELAMSEASDLVSYARAGDAAGAEQRLDRPSPCGWTAPYGGSVGKWLRTPRFGQWLSQRIAQLDQGLPDFEDAAEIDRELDTRSARLAVLEREAS